MGQMWLVNQYIKNNKRDKFRPQAKIYINCIKIIILIKTYKKFTICNLRCRTNIAHQAVEM